MQLYFKLLFGALSFFLTGFIFLNTYEILANQDLPLATAIHPQESQTTLRNIQEFFDTIPDERITDNISNIDTFESIQIRSHNIQTQIEEARVVNGSYYYRPSIIHTIPLNYTQNNQPIDFLLYTTKAWNTIPYPDKLDLGVEVILETVTGTTHTFSIFEKKILALNSPIVLLEKTEARQIILLIDDPSNQLTYVYSLTQN